MTRDILTFITVTTLFGLLASGCSRPNENVSNATQPTRATTPAPPAAEAVQTPANVSFSTYSKEWPVGWQWIDPDEDTVRTPHDTKKAVLRITVPKGKDLSETRQNAPRYMKSFSGDFQIETRLKFSPAENYQGAGLLIYADSKTWLRVERAYGGPGGGASGFRVELCTPDAGQRSGLTTADAPFDAMNVSLRVVRAGDEVTAFFRADENSEWRELSHKILPLPPSVMAGIAACNTAREVTAEFQYIRLLPGVR